MISLARPSTIGLSSCHSYLLVTPYAAPGNTSTINFGDAARWLASHSTPHRFCDFKKNMGALRLAQASYSFSAQDVEITEGGDSMSRGSMLTWKSPDGASHTRTGVFTAQYAASHPEVFSDAKHLIIRADDMMWKGALEFSRSTEAGRPVLLGVADPSEEESAAFLEAEKKRPSRFTDEYYKLAEFERSGRAYRALGVHLFKKVVMALIGRPIETLARKMHESIIRPARELAIERKIASSSEAGGFPDERLLIQRRSIKSSRPLMQMGGHDYFIRGGRNIGSLREFSLTTRQNEAPHAVAGLGMLLPTLAAFPSIFSDTWAGAVLILYSLNAYAAMLQRYNRARVENTIDLKLNRGAFALDIPKIQRKADLELMGQAKSGSF